MVPQRFSKNYVLATYNTFLTFNSFRFITINRYSGQNVKVSSLIINNKESTLLKMNKRLAKKNYQIKLIFG